jgi:diguanylate cyclase (GGDEF)-like protein
MKNIAFPPGSIIKINISAEELASVPPDLRVKLEALISQNDYLLQKQNDSAPSALLRDAATGAFNRHAFFEQANIYFKLMKRYKTTLRQGHNPQMPVVSIASLRLVGLREITEFSGHKAAEEALKDTVDFFARHLRPNDYFSRVGRDEFFILMPIDDNIARQALGRLRAEFEKQFTMPGQSQHYLSFSYGARQLTPEHLSIQQLIAESEQDQRAHH